MGKVEIIHVTNTCQTTGLTPKTGEININFAGDLCFKTGIILHTTAMPKYILLIFAMLYLFLLPGCKNENRSATTSASVIHTDTATKTINNNTCKKDTGTTKVIDVGRYDIDTSIKGVNIDGQLFTFSYVKQEKAASAKAGDEDDEDDNAFVGILAVNEATNKVVYNAPLSSEPRYIMFKAGNAPLSDKGKLYLETLEAYGGSGYAVNLYQVKLAGDSLVLSKILRYGELSCVQCNGDGSEMLVLNGIWDMDAEESHFGGHRYNLKHYHYTGAGYIMNAGDSLVTKGKYYGEEIGEVISQINEKEPRLLKKVNFAGFTPVPGPYN